MPRKPKLMFQMSQNESLGFCRTAAGAPAAWVVMGGSGSLLLGSDTDRLPTAWGQHYPQPARGGHRPARDRDRQGVAQPVRLRPVGVDLGDVATPGREEGERHVEGATALV